ncbi:MULTISPECIES: hypothetical protein [Rhodomicrobium]|uniref:hypothetical protein n=1 Tax=Rhodomicrobium TaxID=1068 RepID=UPI000F74AA07|nr:MULTISPECIES: hypothetical protein [Rhodomicrobium]
MKALILDQIALADTHLCEAEDRIAQQRLRIVNCTGPDRARATALLETFLEIYEQMLIHREPGHSPSPL